MVIVLEAKKRHHRDFRCVFFLVKIEINTSHVLRLR